MKKVKSSVFYVGIIGVFTALMYWIVLLGTKLEVGRNIVVAESSKGQWADFIDSFIHNLGHPLAILLAQIVTIILVAKLFGWICTKIGQPTVIGEMIAGIVLGPSLVGMYFPEFSAMLFPDQSLGNLKFLSQIGLIFFMFIVGMELDLKILRNKTHDAVVISHASIIIPFSMGLGLAYFIYQSFAPEGVQFLSFGLFMGIAMSITAFPVLARIVQERGLSKTRLGTIAITCAAADDITAWCILAAVIAVVKAGSVVSSVYTILLALAYVFLMLKVVRPFLARIGNIYSSRESLSKPVVAIFFLTLIISSYATEVIGIHALFGAFMAGAIMPESTKFRNLFVEKVEDVALVLLLPLFFVFTGLRTQIGLLNDTNLWALAGIIILIAVVGKFLGSAITARFLGQSWKDSLSIGALMNTRGLMELVVLNIGYDLGVLSPEIFSMMVLMALVTTFMTGPALDIINRVFKSSGDEETEENKEDGKYRVLISFGRSGSSRALLNLANDFTKKINGNASLTALHVAPIDEMHQYDADEYEKESFRPLIEESEVINRKVATVFRMSNDIDSEITGMANNGDYDLLLVGMGESIYEGTFLGKLLGFTTRIINPEKLLNTVIGKENIFENSPFDERTNHIHSKAQIPVGFFINKDFSEANRVFIPLFDSKDTLLIPYAQKLIHHTNAQVIVLDASHDGEVAQKVAGLKESFPNNVSLQNDKVLERGFLQQQDLMMVGMDSWKKLVETRSLWLSDIPSTLIISEKV